MNMLIVAVGGGIGAVLRYLIGLYVISKPSHLRIPWAMIIVNLIGSFGLGLFIASSVTPIKQPTLYHLIGIGLFGGFTTFSTFSNEVVQLFMDKKIKESIFYIIITLGGSITMLYIGNLVFSMIKIL